MGDNEFTEDNVFAMKEQAKQLKEEVEMEDIREAESAEATDKEEVIEMTELPDESDKVEPAKSMETIESEELLASLESGESDGPMEMSETDEPVEEVVESTESDEIDETKDISKKAGKGLSKKILWGIGGAVGILLVIYLGFSIYFMKHFSYNTTINGIDVSKMTVQDVEEQFRQQVTSYELVLQKREDKTENIKGTDLGLRYVESDVIANALDEQSPFLWVVSLFREKNMEVTIGVSYDEEMLSQIISALECTNGENQILPVSAQPVYDGEQFEIQEEVYGTQIEPEKLQEVISTYVSRLEYEVDLDAEACYVEPKFKKDDEAVLNAKERMNQCLNASITYDMHPDTEVVDKNTISAWVTADEDMNVGFSDDSVKQYIAALAEKYNTVGKTKSFTTPTGKTTTVSGGGYGWKIDQDEEYEKLLENIKNGDVITREPIYSQKAVSHSATEWGNTYIEVDITEQHMWYIEKGSVIFETDVVTGSPGRDTPQGIYTILEKLRNKVLRGNIMPNGKREYETPVDYWARVTWTGIGFHDATWQSAFGGQRYKQGYGSHGCINMSLDAVSEFYGLISVGCPVIIHY